MKPNVILKLTYKVKYIIQINGALTVFWKIDIFGKNMTRINIKITEIINTKKGTQSP